jgi:hypothetical protein
MYDHNQLEIPHSFIALYIAAGLKTREAPCQGLAERVIDHRLMLPGKASRPSVSAAGPGCRISGE